VNAENELFQARSALRSGQAAAHAAEYRLLAAVGGLVNALGLTEEIVRLDPGPRDPGKMPWQEGPDRDTNKPTRIE
jgi:hypothetical protein